MSNNYGANPTAPYPGMAAEDEYDSMTVAELDAVIEEWEYEIPKSLNKAEKIAALRAADAED
jgi:hypothetical protein